MSPFGIAFWIDRRGQDVPVHGDREVGPDVVRGVVGEQTCAVGLEDEIDRRGAVLVGSDGGRRDLVAAEQRRVLRRIDRLADCDRGVAERNELDLAGVAEHPAHRLDVGRVDDAG